MASVMTISPTMAESWSSLLRPTLMRLSFWPWGCCWAAPDWGAGAAAAFWAAGAASAAAGAGSAAGGGAGT